MTQPVVIEHAHSELGPSASDRWINCPGSVLAIRGIKAPTSVYAAEGTSAHTLSEWCRVQGVSAAKFKGVVLEVDGHKFKVGKPMIEATDKFCAYVGKMTGIPFYEKRVSYEPWAPGGFGTLDDARLAARCYITDYKYGKGVLVHAKGNTQLMLYALGLYYEYRHLFDFEEFVLTVFQPRLNHIDAWTISLKDLLQWADFVAEPIATRALQPGAPFKAGEWCRFCPIKQTCRTRLNADLGSPLAGRRPPRKDIDVADEFEDLDNE